MTGSVKCSAAACIVLASEMINVGQGPGVEYSMMGSMAARFVPPTARLHQCYLAQPIQMSSIRHVKRDGVDNQNRNMHQTVPESMNYHCKSHTQLQLQLNMGFTPSA
jgi:hypothetical protein